MSWVWIAVLAVFAVCGYVGWRKGIIRIVVSLATLIITILAAVFVTPIVGHAVKTNTELYEKLQRTVYEAVYKSDLYKDAVADAVPEEIDASLPIETESYQEHMENLSAYVAQIVETLNLPDDVADTIASAVAPEQILGVLSPLGVGETTVRSVVTAIIAVRLTDIIFHAVIYIIVFMVIFIILRIVVAVTNLISRLPVIHQANKLGGLLVGLAEGLVLVWLLFAVITAFSNTTWAAQALVDIGESKLLSLLYNSNLILKSAFRNL